jgi:hypothetical protein
LTRKTKENAMIPLKYCNSYLKNIYKSHSVRRKNSKSVYKKSCFSIEDINFGVKRLTNGKYKDIEGDQTEILKIGGPILIPNIHKLFNLVVKKGFPKSWTQSLIVPIFRSGDKKNPSNYRTIIIRHILSSLYGSFLEMKISIWIEIQGKIDKYQVSFRGFHSTLDHLIKLRIIA